MYDFNDCLLRFHFVVVSDETVNEQHFPLGMRVLWRITFALWNEIRLPRHIKLAYFTLVPIFLGVLYYAVKTV